MTIDIDELLGKIEKCRAAIQAKGSYAAFYGFTTARHGGNSGLSKANLSYMVSELQKLKEQIISAKEEELPVLKERFKTIKTRVDALVIAVNEYTNTSNRLVNYLGTQWYVYFFYFGIGYRHKVGLGRTVMTISKDAKVYLKNVEDNKSINYEGTLNFDNAEVLSFNLQGPNSESQLHIKVLAQPEFPKLLVGAYLNYEIRKVRCGTIVMEHKMTSENLTPGFYTIDHDDFETIPKPIRRFLAQKSQNILNLPKPIYSIDDLATFMDNYLQDKRHLFFDPEETRVFFASPAQSILNEEHEENSTMILNIKDVLEAKFKSNNIKIKIDYPGGKKPSKQNADFYKNRIVDNFKDLKLTKYFFLFIGQRSLSKSLVELGWALAYCKIVVIFYHDQLLDDPQTAEFINGLSALSESRTADHLELIRYDNSSTSVRKEKEPDFIANKIYSIITNTLNDSFPTKEN